MKGFRLNFNGAVENGVLGVIISNNSNQFRLDFSGYENDTEIDKLTLELYFQFKKELIDEGVL